MKTTKKTLSLGDIFSQAENYLNKHYEISRDTILNELSLQVKNGDKAWQPLNLDKLFVELQKNGIPISKTNLNDLFQTDFVQERCPFKEYFETLPKWDGNDYIQILANHVEANDQEYFNNNFKKWLVRTVKCAIDSKYNHKQTLIISSWYPDNEKSRFCEFISPPALAPYFKSDVEFGSNTINLSRKKYLCQNFLIKKLFIVLNSYLVYS